MNTVHTILLILGICILFVILIYFSVKFGTIGFYKAKQFMEKERKL